MIKRYSLLLFLLFSSVCFTKSFAQLTGWQYREAIKVSERSGQQKLNYPVFLEFNTRIPIALNRMIPDGSDIRFAKDCEGKVLYDFFIDRDFNSDTTILWVNIDTLQAYQERVIYIFYGNPTATFTADFDKVFIPSRTKVIQPGEVDTLNDFNDFDWIEIRDGGKIVARLNTDTLMRSNAATVLSTRKLKIGNNAGIDVSGLGYLGAQQVQRPGFGPGAGQRGFVNLGGYYSGGGGAAYGGDGGHAGYANTGVSGGEGGEAYGNANGTVIYKGSGGGSGAVAGGNGGGALSVFAAHIELRPLSYINSNGSDGQNTTGFSTGGGGGSGGGILLQAIKTALNGATLSLKGGKGGDADVPGGGGGAGRAKVLYETRMSTATFDLAAGAAGTTVNPSVLPADSGRNGSSVIIQRTSTEPKTVVASNDIYQANFSYTETGLQINFADLTPSASSWSWDFGDGSPKSTIPSPSHTYAAEGSYQVCLIAQTPCGSDTICKSVLVDIANTGIYRYKVPVEAIERSGVAKTNYQVLIRVNTKQYVDQGKMNADGSDIRFTSTCAFLDTLSYFIEKGMNTTETRIWVTVPTLVASDTTLFYMMFGNPSAKSYSSFDKTFPPATRLELNSGTTTISANQNYSWIHIGPQATVNLAGAGTLTFNARKVLIEGVINGRGTGYAGGAVGNNSGQGPGSGASIGGGGAYGGFGGNGGAQLNGSSVQEGPAAGGVDYGTRNGLDIESGSGGGSSPQRAGGNGGKGFSILGEDVVLSSAILLDGIKGGDVYNQPLYNAASGGGAGGGLLVRANELNFGGDISATGGDGGIATNYIGGGGGGGGRVKLFFDYNIRNNGFIDVSGGKRGCCGSLGIPDTGVAGSIYISDTTSLEPLIQFTDVLQLTSSELDSTICPYTTTTFAATFGFKSYDFLFDGVSKQSGSSNVLNTSFTTYPDTVEVHVVALDANACRYVSNSFTMIVLPAPNGGITTKDTAICAGYSAQLMASGFTGALQWEDSTMAHSWQSTLGQDTTANYTTPALYDSTWYRIKVTNTYGCVDTSNVTKVAVTPLSLDSAKIINPSRDMAYVCVGSNLQMVAYTSNSLKWQYSNDSIVWQTVMLPDSTNDTLTTANYLIADTIYYRVVATSSNGFCNDTSSVLKVIAEDSNIPGIISIDRNAFCSGTDTAHIVLTSSRGYIQWERIQFPPGGAVYSNVPNGSNIDTLLVTAVADSAYYRARVFNNSCPTTYSDTVIIRGKFLPNKGTMGIDSVAYCGASASTTTTLTISGYSGTIVAWQDSSANNNWTDIVASANDTIVVTPTLNTWYRVVLYNGICYNYSDESFIRVFGTTTPGTLSVTPTIACQNDTMTLTMNGGMATSFIWQMSADSVNGISSIDTTDVPTLKYIPVNGNAYYRAIIVNGLCDTSATNWLKVDTYQPTLTGTITADKNPQCYNYKNKLRLSGYRGDIQWETSPDSMVFTPAGFPNADTLEVQPTDTLFIRARVKNGTCLTLYTPVYRLDVKPLLVPGTATTRADSTCKGSPVIVYAAGFNGTSVKWQGSSDQLNWSFIPGANNDTVTVYPLKDLNFYRAVVSDGNICRDTISNVLQIKGLTPAYADYAYAYDDTICEGTPARVTISGHTGSIQWQEQFAGTDWVDVPGADSATYITKDLYSSVFYRAVVSRSVCVDTSNIVNITVLPKPDPGVILATDDTICQGQSSFLIGYDYFGSRFQWQKSLDNVSFADIANAKKDTLTVKPIQTTFYRLIVKSLDCQDTTQSFRLFVYSSTTTGVLSASGQHCSGTTTTLKITGYQGTIQWQDSTADGGWNNIQLANASTLQVSPLFDTYYRAIIDNGACDPLPTNKVKLTVLQASFAGLAEATVDTLCSGKSAIVTLYQNPIGTIQWQQSANGTTGWTDMNNSTNIDVFVTPAASTFYRAIVSNGICSPATSNVVPVQVRPGVFADTVETALNPLCKGSQLTLNVPGAIGTIQWQQAPNSTNFVEVPGASGNTYTLPEFNVDAYFRVVVKNNYCSDTSDALLVRVSEPPHGGLVQEDKAICQGDYTTISIINQIGSIQWQQGPNTTQWSDIAGENAKNLSTNPLTDTYYRAILSAKNCDDAVSNSVFVDVLDKAKGGTVYRDQTIRPNTNFTLEVDEYDGTIQWQSSQDSVSFTDIVGETDSVLTINIQDRTYYRVRVTNSECVRFSNIVRIDVGTELFSISPNPAKDRVDIKLLLAEDQELEYSLHDAAGKLIFTNKIAGLSGRNTITIDVSMLSGGVYVVSLNGRMGQLREKFIKQD